MTNTSRGRRAKDYTGEVNVMSNGQLATIIASKGSMDNDIRFEDGSIRTGVQLAAFRKGNVQNPSMEARTFKAKTHRIGEKNIMRCGLECEIIDYQNADHITVRFETGEIRKNKQYKHFKSGQISPVKNWHPPHNKETGSNS